MSAYVIIERIYRAVPYVIEKPETGDQKKILFLCTHNAARSQMAEGFVNAFYGTQYLACSAGNEPPEVHPYTVTVIDEVGIDISTHRAKFWQCLTRHHSTMW